MPWGLGWDSASQRWAPIIKGGCGVHEAAAARNGGDGRGCQAVLLDKCCGVHDGELDPAGGHGLGTGTDADVPAAGPAGDASALRGDRQLGSGAYRCSVTEVNPGAETVVVVIDDLAQRVHRGSFTQRDENAGG